jgi:hypothetical protein
MFSKSKRGLGCLILFALPFAVGGLFTGYLAARTLWTWHQARDWVETPARILDTKLDVNQDSDSTTYRVTARYEYTFGEHTYISERVSLTILYRELRWGLLALMLALAIPFTTVGLGMIAGGFWAKRKLDAEEALRAANPDAPWRWKEEWAEGRIRASGGFQFLFPCLFALFWNVMLTPFIPILREELFENENYLALLGLLFPLVGIGLIVWAVRSFIRWKKFGDSVFEMSTVPGVIGGTLAGRVLTSVDIKPASGFELTLSCIRRVTRGSGDSRRTSETILWQEEKQIQRETLDYDPTRSTIPVHFSIPYDTEPSEARSVDDETLWRLEVTAEIPGVDYASQFEVPVFKTAESRPDSVPEESSFGENQIVRDPQAELAREGIVKEYLATGGFALRIPAARHKGAAWLVTIFFVVWSAITVLLVFLEAPIIFPVVWGVFDFLLLFGVLDLWLERRRIEVRPDRLVLSGGILGWGKPKEIPRSAIRDIKPVRGMQAGKKLYYRIQVETEDGKKHVAATKIGELTVARQIIAEMQPE